MFYEITQTAVLQYVEVPSSYPHVRDKEPRQEYSLSSERRKYLVCCLRRKATASLYVHFLFQLIVIFEELMGIHSLFLTQHLQNRTNPIFPVSLSQ